MEENENQAILELRIEDCNAVFTAADYEDMEIELMASSRTNSFTWDSLND